MLTNNLMSLLLFNLEMSNYLIQRGFTILEIEVSQYNRNKATKSVLNSIRATFVIMREDYDLRKVNNLIMLYEVCFVALFLTSVKHRYSEIITKTEETSLCLPIEDHLSYTKPLTGLRRSTWCVFRTVIHTAISKQGTSLQTSSPRCILVKPCRSLILKKDRTYVHNSWDRITDWIKVT